DAIFEDDCRIWDGRVTKVWGEVGQIIIGEIA
ncbi:RusA family crossover junction endodeoxyribonuclease, partial [Serratia marcescens]